jgi:hypothetical protein
VPVEQGGRERAAQLPHDGRRGGPAADDVADGERDAVVVDRDEVVPVAARLGVGVASEVARRRGQTGQPGQLAGQQAALQGVGDLVLHGVQPRPVQRLRALSRDRADDRALAGAHPGTGAAEGEADRADRPALQQQRDDGVGRQAVATGGLARPHRMSGAHGAGQRVLGVDPQPPRRACQHLQLLARAHHDHGVGRAERQRVPGDHGGDLRGGRRP